MNHFATSACVLPGWCAPGWQSPCCRTERLVVQISQTAGQKPAVNGNRLTINNVLLRDIRIQAVQASSFWPGKRWIWCW